MTDVELERIRNRCNSTRYGDDPVAVLVQAQNDARALFREVERLRMRAKGIEAFLKLLDERMELAGLSEFWKTHYTDKERLALAEGSISFAVSSVKFNKRWDDNMQRTKRNE